MESLSSCFVFFFFFFFFRPRARRALKAAPHAAELPRRQGGRSASGLAAGAEQRSAGEHRPRSPSATAATALGHLWTLESGPAAGAPEGWSWSRFPSV